MSAPDTLERPSSVRRVSRVLLWIVAILVAAVAVNIIGISVLGGAQGWDRWLNDHKWYFLAWRMCVYLAVAYGWYWVHERVVQRETNKQASVRLLRAESFAVIVIVLFEASVLWQGS